MKTYKQNVPELYLGRKKSEAQKVKIFSSKDSADYFRQIWDEDTLEFCESCIVIYLNRANNTIGWYKISQGGMNATVVDVKLILAGALKSGASGLIIAHNHPSGNLSPSNADDKLTSNLVAACKIMDITMLDHVILTEKGHYSYADEGTLF